MASTGDSSAAKYLPLEPSNPDPYLDRRGVASGSVLPHFASLLPSLHRPDALLPCGVRPAAARSSGTPDGAKHVVCCRRREWQLGGRCEAGQRRGAAARAEGARRDGVIFLRSMNCFKLTDCCQEDRDTRF